LTIACGLKFAEGVLVCADTEMSYGGELKARATKIFAYEFESNGGSKAIFTYSGAAHYAKMLIQQCEYILQQQPPERMARQGMLNIIQNELYKFHHKHIYKHPQYQMVGGPDFWLVLALWSPTDGLAIYESSDEAIVEVTDSDMYACIGAGATLARYLLHSLMMHPYLKLADVSTIGTFVLAEVKAWIQGCGGGSELIAIRKDGDLSGIGWFDISHVDPFSEVFQQSMKQLFLRACDLEERDEEITQHMNALAMQIDSLRNHLRTENRRNLGLRDLVDALTKRKVTKH
jgi:20S proteasome alpha/beta subunit